jgi:hypothetical protein
MLFQDPVEKLSIARTRCPSANSVSAKCDAMNPAPPVIKQVLGVIFFKQDSPSTLIRTSQEAPIPIILASFGYFRSNLPRIGASSQPQFGFENSASS